MNKMALLLATDKLDKMEVFRTFLAEHPKAVWRTQDRYTPIYLAEIARPINLYFFYRSTIRYRAHCIGIYSGTKADSPLALTPPEYRADRTPYTLFIMLDKLVPVSATPINTFSKWDNPNERFERGQQGLLRVQDTVRK